jgi:sugar phosphate isomerase/epimerase
MSDLLVGLQLYTVRDQTAQDFTGTIRRVAEMGYKGVEFAGYGGLSASELAALLKEAGLQAAGTHVGLGIIQDNLEQAIDYCLEIGCPNLIVPYVQPDLLSGGYFQELAELFNKIGRRCQERGLAFAFHNHNGEFTQADGKYLLDILLDNTDPAYLKLELDSYWAAYAGADPIAYLGKRSGRVPLVHMKDMTAQRTFTEVGDGTLDIAGIIKAAQAAGTQWFIVENDAPSIPSLESARRSLENLRKF